ncbi:hypothetical protein LEP1GSC024_0484 [Leptospira noguchii str. 2001034031]|uniref:Uncharacterized protein n=1 Tax=Leptospira noguchii str. 2001034031 TaxID=1193053 RepID=M6Y522_9LEPT|nr:hypothetical protein LEP1GSC024_0484 [Leptospira noguchii str. 2001034031]
MVRKIVICNSSHKLSRITNFETVSVPTILELVRKVQIPTFF